MAYGTQMMPGGGTSLGFPSAGGPTMTPGGGGTGAPLQGHAAPTGVMPMNPGAGGNPGIVPPAQGGSPVPQGPDAGQHQRPSHDFGNHQPGQAFGGGMENFMSRMMQRQPGFLDRLQSMFANQPELLARIQQRFPGFQMPGQPAPPVGAGTAPASTAPPATAAPGAPAAAPAAPTTLPANYAALSQPNPVVFNPLNLSGMGG